MKGTLDIFRQRIICPKHFKEKGTGMILKAGINKLSIILLLCFSGIPFPARAGDFDGSTPVFCAITRMLECQKKSGCE